MLGERGGVRMGLYHGVLGVRLDHMLQLGDDVAERDDKAPRVAAHGLVLSATKRDEPIAAELPALAAEGDDSIAAFAGDALIELAKNHLIMRDAPRCGVVHVAVGLSAQLGRRDLPRPRPTALRRKLVFSAARRRAARAPPRHARFIAAAPRRHR